MLAEQVREWFPDNRSTFGFHKTLTIDWVESIIQKTRAKEPQFEMLGTSKLPQEREKDIPYALRPGRVNVLSFDEHVNCVDFPFFYRGFDRDRDDPVKQQMAFLCGQCFGNCSESITVMVSSESLERSIVWYFLLGTMCREAGPSPYRVQVEPTKRAPYDTGFVTALLDFLAHEIHSGVWGAAPRADCRLLLSFLQWENPLPHIAEMHPFHNQLNLGCIKVGISQEMLQPENIDALRNEPVSIRELHLSGSAPEPEVQTLLVRFFDLDAIDTLTLTPMLSSEIEQAWLRFWRDMCPNLRCLHFDTIVGLKSEFGDPSTLDANLDGFSSLETVTSKRSMSLESLRSLPPLQRLEFKTDVQTLASFQHGSSRDRLLAEQCHCTLYYELLRDTFPVYDAILALGNCVSSLFLTVIQNVRSTSLAERELEFLQSFRQDPGKYKAQQCERFVLQWPGDISRLSDPMVQCERIRFFLSMFQGARSFQMTDMVMIQNATETIDFLTGMTDLFVSIREQFYDHLPNLRLVVVCPLAGFDEKMPDQEFIRQLEALVAVLVDLLEAQMALGVPQMLDIRKLVEVFRRVAPLYNASKKDFDKPRSTSLLRQWSDYKLFQEMEELQLDPLDTTSIGNQTVSWHRWKERLQLLTEHHFPGFLDQFCPSGSEQDDVLALLALNLKGISILY